MPLFGTNTPLFLLLNDRFCRGLHRLVVLEIDGVGAEEQHHGHHEEPLRNAS